MYSSAMNSSVAVDFCIFIVSYGNLAAIGFKSLKCLVSAESIEELDWLVAAEDR